MSESSRCAHSAYVCGCAHASAGVRGRVLAVCGGVTCAVYVFQKVLQLGVLDRSGAVGVHRVENQVDVLLKMKFMDEKGGKHII